MRQVVVPGLLLSALFAGLLAPSSRAQLSQAGSLLIFAEYDTRPGHTTLITITNTHASQTTYVKFNYVNSSSCTLTDRIVALTAEDTFTVSAATHVGGGTQRGYVYVTVVKGSGAWRPISFNHLIGVATHFDGTSALTYSLNPVAYTSPKAQGALTDIDLDSVLDLNGEEYQQCADVLRFPRFVAQSASVNNELVLIALSGGTAFTTIVDFLIHNDNEVIFSQSHQFYCWKRVSLTSIGASFSDSFLKLSNHNPAEQFSNGNETGWFTVHGAVATSSTTTIIDPAVLAVLIEPAYETMSELPFGQGLQSNGDLLPNGPGGDTH